MKIKFKTNVAEFKKGDIYEAMIDRHNPNQDLIVQNNVETDERTKGWPVVQRKDVEILEF